MIDTEGQVPKDPRSMARIVSTVSAEFCVFCHERLHPLCPDTIQKSC